MGVVYIGQANEGDKIKGLNIALITKTDCFLSIKKIKLYLYFLLRAKCTRNGIYVLEREEIGLTKQ